MALIIKSANELSAAAKKLYDRATTAVAQKNFTYAINILKPLLKNEPGFQDGRKLLRQAQLELAGRKAHFFKNLLAYCQIGWKIQLQGSRLLTEEKAADALDLAETAMAVDPTLPLTLSYLAKAEKAAGWIDVAIQTMEIAVSLHPRKTWMLLELAHLFTAIEDHQNALRIWQKIVALNPHKLEYESATKQVSAMAAMKQGNWEGAQSYRDIIKNQDSAKTLEQQNRISVRDEETLKDLIGAAEKAVGEQATATNCKRLAELYRQALEFDKALEQYQKVIEITGTMDPAIDAAMTEVYCDRFDHAIEQWKTYAKNNPAQADEAERNLRLIEQQKEDLLLQRLKERVQRYPNDCSYHFELGEKLFNLQKLDEALQEFQFSQRSPQYRWRALAGMGKCMVGKNLLDMGIEQYNAALAGMDKNAEERNAVLYDLGQAYQAKGMTDEALAVYKDIFSRDVNFRDVTDKIQAYYQKKETTRHSSC